MQCVMERWRKIAWTSRCENPIKNTEFGISRRWFLLMGRWFTPLAGAADQARLAGNQTERTKLSICNFSERGRLQSDLIVLGLWRHSWCHHGGNCQVQRRSKMMRSIFLWNYRIRTVTNHLPHPLLYCRLHALPECVAAAVVGFPTVQVIFSKLIIDLTSDQGATSVFIFTVRSLWNIVILVNVISWRLRSTRLWPHFSARCRWPESNSLTRCTARCHPNCTSFHIVQLLVNVNIYSRQGNQYHPDYHHHCNARCKWGLATSIADLTILRLLIFFSSSMEVKRK